MTIPSFTAEASLDRRSGESYRPKAWSHGQSEGAIQPAQPLSFLKCVGDCFHECLAFHPPSKAGCMTMCRILCRLGG
jgi:hypothetical protein